MSVATSVTLHRASRWHLTVLRRKVFLADPRSFIIAGEISGVNLKYRIAQALQSGKRDTKIANSIETRRRLAGGDFSVSKGGLEQQG